MISAPEKDDWRRQGQERFLKDARLSHRAYRPYRAGWDHDHCEFCGAKLSLAPDGIREGYCTEDGYHWVCEDCFQDFKEEFAWAVV